jgi:hypothetical protein
MCSGRQRFASRAAPMQMQRSGSGVQVWDVLAMELDDLACRRPALVKGESVQIVIRSPGLGKGKVFKPNNACKHRARSFVG